MSSTDQMSVEEFEEEVAACRAYLLELDSAPAADDRDSDDAERDDALEHMGRALLGIHTISQQPDTLEEAISVYEQSLELRPVGHPRRLVSLSGLGNALKRFCEHNGDNITRMRAYIQTSREALQLCPANYAGRSVLVTQLAIALGIQFSHCGGLDSLNEAVALHRENVTLLPPGHPRRDMALQHLANALRLFYEHQGIVDALHEAISLYREVLEVRTVGHPDRGMALDALGMALMISLERHDDTDTLAQITDIYREVLTLHPPGHPLRASALLGLADAHLTSFKRQGNVGQLHESIRLSREALELTPEGHPSRYLSLDGLGMALLTSYSQGGGSGQLTEAIILLREALPLNPVGHRLRDCALNNLANALTAHFEQQGDDKTLGEVITLQRETLRLRPTGHPLRASTLNNLGNALRINLKRYGGDETLTEATASYREAVQLRPDGDPYRDGSLEGLANTLLIRFERQGDVQSLAEAIALYREALLLRPPGHPTRDSTLVNLANALWTLFNQRGRLEVLAEAIALYRQALEICLVGHPSRDKALNNLATALHTRYEQQGDMKTLHEVIHLHREALLLCPQGHPMRDSALSNLANALAVSSKSLPSPLALSEAVTLHREALQLRHWGHPSRDLTLEGLADALFVTYDHGGSTETLTEAIILLRATLQLRPLAHPLRPRALVTLAGLLRVEYERSNDTETLTEALLLSSQAVDLCAVGNPERASALFLTSRIILIPHSPSFDFSRGMAYISDGLADDFASARERLAHASQVLSQMEVIYPLAIRHFDRAVQEMVGSRLLALYAQTIRLLPRAANFGLVQKARLEATVGLEEISRNAAARALQMGRVPEAIEMLEEGRGVFWAQALNMRASGLEGVPAEDRRTLEHIFETLESGSRTLSNPNKPTSVVHREQILEHRRELNEQAEALISKIRTHTGLQRFLMPAAFDNLMQSLPEGYIVVLNASTLGSHALLLNRSAGLSISLELKPLRDSFDSDTIRAALPRDMPVDALGARSSETQERGITRAMGIAEQRTEPFEGVLRKLWKRVVQPIVRKLNLEKAKGRARPRVWWCVTGQLGFLPIHAAGKYSGDNQAAASDYIVSSYVPTLSALVKARNQWTPIPRSEIAALLICETSSGPDRLFNVVDEVEAVRSCLDAVSAKVLNTPSAHTSLAETQGLLENIPAHIVHLACHGVQASDPLDSSFVLQDGRLSIEDIMMLDLPHATLAYLSACQTAKGSRLQPDQAVHLAASMLFCGFRSVVGTMWRMHDEDGPQVARNVYQSLFEKDELELNDIPYALDEAVHKLRNSGVKPWRWSLFVHMGG